MFDLVSIVQCVPSADPYMMQAIIMQESRGIATAYHVNKWKGKRLPFGTIREAATAVQTFLEAGYTVDVGLMGIHSKNLEKFATPIPNAFDECTNLRLGANILYENLVVAISKGWEGDDVLQVALSLSRGFRNRYVYAVWEHYRRSTDEAGQMLATDVDIRSALDDIPPAMQ